MLKLMIHQSPQNIIRSIRFNIIIYMFKFKHTECALAAVFSPAKVLRTLTCFTSLRAASFREMQTVPLQSSSCAVLAVWEWPPRVVHQSPLRGGSTGSHPMESCPTCFVAELLGASPGKFWRSDDICSQSSYNDERFENYMKP